GARWGRGRSRAGYSRRFEDLPRRPDVDGDRRLRDPGAQEVVEVHDADRLAAIHHDELRLLHRVEQLERFADKLVGPHGLRLRRHPLLDFEVKQVRAHVPAQVPYGYDSDEMSTTVGDTDAAEGLGRHLGDRFRHAGADRGERDLAAGMHDVAYELEHRAKPAARVEPAEVDRGKAA